MNNIPAPNPATVAASSAVKKTILIAEDDRVTATLLEAKLKEKGYELIIAHDGKDALALAQTRNPDLIISDVVMPEINGYEFYKSIKKNPVTAGIPVLILSSYTKMSDTFAVLGADEFMSKPIDTEKLLNKVTIFLARERKSAEATVAAAALLPESNSEAESKKTPTISKAKAKIIVGIFILAVLCLLYFLVSMFTSQLKAKNVEESEVLEQLEEVPVLK